MLQLRSCTFGLLLALGLFAGPSTGREWTSASGSYKLDAEEISFNETMVVLKRPTGELVAVEIAQLSEADKEYIQSQEAKEAKAKAADEMQTWTSKDGMKVRGRVTAYGRKDLIVQRKLGQVLVNEKKFQAIDPLHQRLVFRILTELEGTTIGDEKQLHEWSKTLGGVPKTYALEGVLMQLESGDEIGVPFFLFTPEELKILEPGWELWKERAESEDSRNRESFLVHSAALAYQQDRAANQQIEMLKLDMLGAVAGVTAIWQVGLVPGPRTYGRPMTVMVTAQNSDIASQNALQRYPGYIFVGVRKASR